MRIATSQYQSTMNASLQVNQERVSQIMQQIASNKRILLPSDDPVDSVRLSRLEREESLKLVWYRTGAKVVQSNLLPYIVEVVAADKPGILFQLADFFDRQGITIENLQSTRYRAMQTGAEMFSAQVTIGVPANMHIAALRDDFLEFCDHLNLAAIMDPMKF